MNLEEIDKLCCVFNKHKTTAVHFRVIYHCITPRMMTEIAKHCGFSTANSTGLVDKLEAIGLVQRIASVTDRRSTSVITTGKGLAFLNTLKDEANAEE